MADLPAHGDGVEEHLGALPPQDNQLQDEVQPEALQGGAGRRIPIVSTLESEPELPPNWNTGALPPAPGGMLSNLPPLPPSLGSVSGRASTRSGYTPRGGGELGALANSRSGSDRTQRTEGSVRRIQPRPFNITGRYVNVDTASQNLGDRLEGPAREPGAEAMGAAWMDLGPPIPA